MKNKIKLPKFLTPKGRILKKAEIIANTIETLKDKYRKMSDEDLCNMTDFFLAEIQRGKTLDELLPEAMAVARETIYRVHGLFAYYVQLVGAIIVHTGDFAEMYTGEGKTLTLLLVAYVNALSKKGVHIVTVNEYLVKRDAEFCAQALNPLKITVGYNTAEMDPSIKKQMYACDVTYTTNSELGFDYLRDNMVKEHEEKVIRELNFAIVDEADSVLIDEARTPLIISGQPKKDVSLYVDVDSFVKTLKDDDYKIDAESNSISLTEKGIKKAENNYKLANLFDLENSDLVHKIKNSLMANFVFRYGVEYIVREGEIVLVDHFTGRIMEGRSYNAGLHQAIQAKEKVKIEPENVIVATITYQAFFRLYKKLAGVSGTAMTEAEEFLKIYNMVVVSVPTNKKNVRKDMSDFVFNTKKAKWEHVAAEIEKVHATGQPMLIGTGSVEDSEELAHLLRNRGINFELLNAKNHAREAEIVSKAGQLGSITISTNMAGRGTDIKLGKGVIDLGGLYVIGTDRHESRRVDNQLRGRSGRQGDPGITRFFISLDDVLFKRFAGEKMEKANDKIDEDEYFDSWFFNKLLISMQKKVEGMNFDIRKNLIDYDIVLSNQRELVYKQRDQILKNEDNMMIISNMAKKVADDLVTLFVDKQNPVNADSIALSKAINSKLLFFNILSPDTFKDMPIIEARDKVLDIIMTSIENRTSLMVPEQINKTIRSMMIQNLDSQWTNHLDKMSKIREGVSLRSLEQRSPLNIYVEDADKNFGTMTKNVAHQVIISIHRLYIPKTNEGLIEKLFAKGYISLEDKNKALENMKTISASPNMMNSNMQQRPGGMRFNFGPKNPGDKPLSDAQRQTQTPNQQFTEINKNNRAEFLKQMQQKAMEQMKARGIDIKNIQISKVEENKPVEKSSELKPIENQTIKVQQENNMVPQQSLTQQIDLNPENKKEQN